MADRSKSVLGLAAALLAAGLLAGCASAPPEGPDAGSEGATAPRGLDDLTLVDCLLPGQIRQLGTRMTYLSPRRHVKTTRSDCGIRGGEFVAFDRSDYRTALAELLPKAQAGDAVAQTYVGEIYERGLGLPGPDYAQAAQWYRRAAEAGHAPAQTALGSLYERGLGVPQDRRIALDWYRQATGLSRDRLVFESELDAARAEFAREIRLRNQIAEGLREELQRAGAASASSPAPQPAVSRAELERAAESLRREVASESERVRRELHAVEEIKRADSSDDAASESRKKAAQIGKLELSLREQSDALADNARRLSMLQ